MARELPTWTLDELAQLLGGTREGSETLDIRRPASAEDDAPDGLTFATNERYLTAAEASKVGAVLIGPDMRGCAKPAIRLADPRAAFGKFLSMCARPLPLEPGVHEKAVVHPEAQVHPTASVGPFAVVEQGASIGAGARVFPFCYVGESCVVEARATLYPHVVLYQEVTVGEGTIVHAGAVLGADGFGYAWDGQRRIKVPQVGTVRLEDDVEVGANTTIDRATAGETVIGTGTKIDNLVQIAHNSRIGSHGVIASLTGLSGSTIAGDRVVMGGQVATSGHLRIGDDVTLSGRTGVTKDVLEPGTYFGLPARPYGEATRLHALQQKLPDLVRRIKELERKIAEIEGQM